MHIKIINTSSGRKQNTFTVDLIHNKFHSKSAQTYIPPEL